MNSYEHISVYDLNAETLIHRSTFTQCRLINVNWHKSTSVTKVCQSQRMNDFKLILISCNMIQYQSRLRVNYLSHHYFAMFTSFRRDTQ